MNSDLITGRIIESAINVHSALGPGLLESAYQVCLIYELASFGLDVQSQVLLPVRYRGIKLDAGYRIDLLVADTVVVEVKSVTSVTSVV